MWVLGSVVDLGLKELSYSEVVVAAMAVPVALVTLVGSPALLKTAVVTAVLGSVTLVSVPLGYSRVRLRFRASSSSLTRCEPSYSNVVVCLVPLVWPVS